MTWLARWRGVSFATAQTAGTEQADASPGRPILLGLDWGALNCQFGCAAVSAALTYDGSGRIDTVSRTHTGGSWGTGTETATVRYGVNIGAASSSSDDTHPDLAAGHTWAQWNPAVTATAVFAPSGQLDKRKFVSGR